LRLTRRGALRGIGTTTIAATVGVGLGAGSAAATPDNETTLRVVHAAPDAPAVDVYIDGSRVLSEVPFRTASDFLPVDPATYTVAITAAGDPEAVVFEGDVTIEDDVDYTVTALGELGADTFSPLVSVDDRHPQEGFARVRALHAVPDAPSVDVTVNDGAATLVDGLAFGEITEEYAEVDPGEYHVEVRPATADDDGDAVYETSVEVAGNAVYSVFATGYLDGPEPFELLVTEDTDLN
jgi:hypothetical protein